MSEKRYLNTKELREEFGIAESTQAKYRGEKSIPYAKLGGFIFYSREKIYEWIENHNVEMTGE